MTDKEIAAQLRKPSGEIAGIVGTEMCRKNKAMIDSTIQRLNIFDGKKLLEIGFGNGGHVEEIFLINQSIHYSGIELSKSMVWEGEKNCKELIRSGKVLFYHTDGNTIPLQEKSIDVVFSVNTIYFWENVSAYLDQINRVLVPGGQIVLTFGAKSFIETLSFTRHGFNLYGSDELKLMVSKSGFSDIHSENLFDKAKSANGDIVDREFVILSASKM
jgi:SAM-dependent methyltransferase